MSLIKLQGNPSGSGAFTIAAPNGNTDRTLTLPDATGTVLAAPAGAVTINSSAPSNSLTLDGSGNLGLGVTPSAWGGQRALEFAYGGLSIGSSLGVELAANTFWNGSNWIYRVSSQAYRYEQDSAGHKFFTSPSGTAGNAVTFTERVRIDSDGLKFNGDTAAANALDDYEQGTWTPQVQGASTAGTYTVSISTARYTKIGNQVTLWAYFGFSAASGGTGYAQIRNIPFAYDTGLGIAGTVFTANFDFSTANPATVAISGSFSASNTVMNLIEVRDAAGGIDAPVSGISTSTLIGFTVTYTAT